MSTHSPWQDLIWSQFLGTASTKELFYDLIARGSVLVRRHFSSEVLINLTLKVVQDPSLNNLGPHLFIRGHGLQPLFSSIGWLPWSLPGKVNIGMWRACFKASEINGLD